MSVLLDELIELRRSQAISYQEYLEKVRELAMKVKRPASGGTDLPCECRYLSQARAI